MAQEQEWQTLSGTVENIVYCNEENGYTVLEFSSGGDLYTAVGELSDVNVGEDVTLHGRFVTHPSFGEQFRVEACEVRMPESATASVGDRTAASAKAGIRGIPGTSQ